MKRVVLKHIPLRTNRFAAWPSFFQRTLFVLFLIQFALVWSRLWTARPLFGDVRWPEGLLVVLATATTLASMARHLPGQNVMLASSIIAVIAGAVHTIGALSGIPFGPYAYTSNMGQELFHPLPWAMPLIWIVLVLNSRGAARIILRPWRTTQRYGFWLLGLTALLVVMLEIGLEPFATRVKQYWLWHPAKTTVAWYGAPWVNFIGWGVSALLILAFVTPSLINKNPAPATQPDYHPLVIWLLLTFLFGTAAWTHELWAASLVVFSETILVAAFGLRWRRAG